MIQPKNQPLISGTQFIAIVVLTIAIFLVVDFSRRTTASYYAAQAEQRLEQQIQAELERQAKLKARRDYAASDQFVEEWARENHMIRPGDQPMIIITPASPQAQIEILQTAPQDSSPQSVPNWYRWWLLFFGDEAGA
jgi:hypothetical protein